MATDVQGWRPAVGHRLDDRYTLSAERNVGLTGVVYAARDERLGEDVVVILGLWTALQYPWVFVVLLVLFVALMIWFSCKPSTDSS